MTTTENVTITKFAADRSTVESYGDELPADLVALVEYLDLYDAAPDKKCRDLGRSIIHDHLVRRFKFPAAVVGTPDGRKRLVWLRSGDVVDRDGELEIRDYKANKGGSKGARK